MEHVGFRPQILSLLRRLHQGRCLLAVILTDDKQIYNSALLEVNAEHDFIVLDELKPDHGHTILLAQQSIRVRAQLKGVSVAFTAALVEAGRRDGIAYYRFALPKALHYGQRRAHYRPRVGHANKTAVELDLPTGEVSTGTLQDLSLGGLRVKLDREITGLRLNTALPCRLNLPDSTTFACIVEIRFLGGVPTCQLGGRFGPLPPHQRQLLQKFLRELEREELKRNPRDGR